MAKTSHAFRLSPTVEELKSRPDEGAIEPTLLHEFFERQVMLRPDHPAVECNGQSWTYAQLNERANAIADLLRSRDVGPGVLVAVYMTKSCELFAALLGVLKAGAGYVPIDITFPIARTKAILDDAGVAIVLTEGTAGTALAPHIKVDVVDLNKQPREEVRPAGECIAVTPNDVCYVIYTSGSTGTPKGVVIEHRNAVNYVRALHKVYGLDEGDRIYQGFSIAFDASVEEIWAAFSLGGTLVVPCEDIARSTTDAAEFIKSQRVSCFSTVPSFLALMEPSLPTVRLLILGGEVCPPDLVNRCARPGLRMLNTYGPTEATVVATAAECRPGEPVTIGTAMPGYETYVLDENLMTVKPGECGELYIGGHSIARGYMNQPELTAERFIRNPFLNHSAPFALLYRTFDLVRLTEDGSLQFLGRADGQVKIRGFRVELSEIESVLMEYPSIGLAAVNTVDICGSTELAAYVVLNKAGPELQREHLNALLRGRLPAYMVPKYLEVLDVLPTATSGKVDRKALPDPFRLLNESNREVIAPVTALQRMVVDAWERALQIAPISVRADFFLDLNGHSFVAAKIVTDLRTTLHSNQISVRDIYQYRTVEDLTQHFESIGITVGSGNESEPRSRWQAETPLSRFRWVCAALQLVGLLAFYGVISSPVVFAVIIVLKVLDGAVEWYVAADFVTVVGFGIWPSWLLLGVALKWIVIGRYKAGRYPVWGSYYFRWWLVSRFQELSWSQMFVGTPLMSLYYRLMGAKVGKNCTIGTPLCAAFDLVDIGQNTSVDVDTHLLGYRVENGYLILGNITIGRDCFVGTHCCLGLNVVMHDGSRLDDMSLLADNMVMAKDEGRRGSPAMPAEVTVPAQPLKKSRRGASFAFGLIHLALIYAMGYVLIFSAVPAVVLVSYTLYVAGPAAGIAVAFAAVPVSILWYLQIVILVKNVVIGKIFPGSYRLHSVAYLRYWFLSYLLNNTREILLPLYATLFFPRVLRQLGAKIGRMVEISTIMHAMPDLIEIDDGSFLADACIVGGHRIHNGIIEIQPNKIGKRTFVGNSAFLPAGVDLGNNGLLGVMSTPPVGVSRTPDDTRWLGSPGFELPSIEKVTSFTVRQTFEPSYFLVAMRALVDLLRVLLPGIIAMASIVLFCSAIAVLYREAPLLQVILFAPAIALILSFISLVCVAGLKTLLMGKFVPTQRPLWSAYVWFNEVVNALYETVSAATLTPLMGTPFISPFLRLMGCRIGHWVFLETTLFSEFDLIRIGNRASLNLGCTIQPHLFEDRVMKADTVAIGDGCSIGNMAVVLYSTEMQDGSSLGPLSVLMKGEGLPAASHWYGIPTQPMILSTDGQEYRQSATRPSVRQVETDKSTPWIPEGELVSIAPETVTTSDLPVLP